MRKEAELFKIQKVGKRLSEIIAIYGQDAFKKIEKEVLSTVKLKNVVFSTGGSAVYYPEAMEHLKSLGTVVYLYSSYEVIEARIKDVDARGVVRSPGQTLKDVYYERLPLYEKYADVTVDCNGTHYSKYRERLLSVMKYIMDYSDN